MDIFENSDREAVPLKIELAFGLWNSSSSRLVSSSTEFHCGVLKSLFRRFSRRRREGEDKPDKSKGKNGIHLRKIWGATNWERFQLAASSSNKFQRNSRAVEVSRIFPTQSIPRPMELQASRVFLSSLKINSLRNGREILLGTVAIRNSHTITGNIPRGLPSRTVAPSIVNPLIQKYQLL